MKWENPVKIICVGVNQLLLKLVFKKVPETGFSVFSILRGRVIAWVDLFSSEMRKNLILHIFIPIWVLKMMRKPVFNMFFNFA